MPVKGGCKYCAALSSLCDHERVAEYRDGVLHIGGLIPTDQQLDEMAKEAMLLKQSGLWKILTETVKAQALDLGIRHAKDFDQLMFAKAMLHVVDVQLSAVAAIEAENSKRLKGKTTETNK